MEILKIATDWVKAEVFSSLFFVFFWIVFVFASLGFWQLGKTELAKAYIIPTLIAGVLFLIIWLGLIYSYQSKINNFPISYNNDSKKFVETEIIYVEKTLNDYKNTVFTAIPIIIAICAILLIFISTPIWKSSLITIIAFLAILLLVDGTASNRLENYYKQLKLIESQELN